MNQVRRALGHFAIIDRSAFAKRVLAAASPTNSQNSVTE
jgi:hypothetical protein